MHFNFKKVILPLTLLGSILSLGAGAAEHVKDNAAMPRDSIPHGVKNDEAMPTDSIHHGVKDVAPMPLDSIATVPLKAVKIQFIDPTTFLGSACNLESVKEHEHCAWYSQGVGKNVALPALTGVPDRNVFCVDVTRWPGLRWGHYFFKVDASYAGDAFKWWGQPHDPHYELPIGIEFLKFVTDNQYTRCYHPWEEGK